VDNAVQGRKSPAPFSLIVTMSTSVVAELWQNSHIRSGLIASFPASDSSISD